MSAVASACKEFEKMVVRDSQGWGDQGNALERCAKQIGVSVSVADKIKRRKVKTLCGNVIERIRRAALKQREREVQRLLHEIAIEKEIGGTNDQIERLEAEAEALASKVATLLQQRTTR